MQTPSFFDYAMRHQGGRKSTKFLEEMKTYIPYEAIEELLIQEGVYRPKKKGTPGRPPYPCKVLVGALFLQAWYGLSDPMTEEMIHDRISFRKFLDIQADDDIPDETTICNFRNALMEKMLFDRIFDQVKTIMQENNLLLQEGSLVDATLIHSSEPKRKKDAKGRTLSNRAADPDATYTAKRGRKYHGYKLHVATDKHGMIKEVVTTTASASEIKQLPHLLKEEKSYFFGDSAHMSKAIKKACREKGIFYGVIERRVRGQAKLRAKQRKNNRRFAAVRAIVELPFAFIKRWMHYTQTRFIGLEKNDQYHLLLAAAYNLRRAPAMQRKLQSG